MAIVTEWYLDEQVNILTSNIMEFYDDLDPYGPRFPDPEVIVAVMETVKDLKECNITDIIDNLNEVKEGNGDDADIVKAVDEIIEDLNEYKTMYEEFYGTQNH